MRDLYSSKLDEVHDAISSEGSHKTQKSPIDPSSIGFAAYKQKLLYHARLDSAQLLQMLSAGLLEEKKIVPTILENQMESQRKQYIQSQDVSSEAIAVTNTVDAIEVHLPETNEMKEQNGQIDHQDAFFLKHDLSGTSPFQLHDPSTLNSFHTPLYLHPNDYTSDVNPFEMEIFNEIVRHLPSPLILSADYAHYDVLRAIISGSSPTSFEFKK